MSLKYCSENLFENDILSLSMPASISVLEYISRNFGNFSKTFLLKKLDRILTEKTWKTNIVGELPRKIQSSRK